MAETEEFEEEKDPSFEEWLEGFFGQPVGQSVIDFEPEISIRSTSVQLKYITRAFENSALLLLPFSDGQLNQSLWDLANESNDYCRGIFDEQVPLSIRIGFVRSIYSLFEECFVRRCSQSLSHLDEPKASPLNSVCYMWWDIFPTWGSPRNPSVSEIYQEILLVMQKTLSLDSDACKESALHGLGHWHLYHPQEVESIIDEFLAHAADIRPQLTEYALNARHGYVL